MQVHHSPGLKRGRYFRNAVLLARKGRYAEANHALQQALDNGECGEIEALDLQARIFAQQGLYFEAESLWRQAKALDPTNPASDQSIARLRRDRSVGFLRNRLFAYVGVLAFFIVMIWQAAAIRQVIKMNFNLNENAILQLQGDIAGMRDATQESRSRLGSAMADLEQSMIDRDALVTQRLDAMMTPSEFDAHQRVAFESVKAELAEIMAAVDGIASGFTERDERDQQRAAMIAGIENRMDRFETQVLNQMEHLPTNEQLTADRDMLSEKAETTAARIEKGFSKTAHDLEQRLITLSARLIDLSEKMDREFGNMTDSVDALRVSVEELEKAHAKQRKSFW